MARPIFICSQPATSCIQLQPTTVSHPPPLLRHERSLLAVGYIISTSIDTIRMCICTCIYSHFLNPFSFNSCDEHLVPYYSNLHQLLQARCRIVTLMCVCDRERKKDRERGCVRVLRFVTMQPNVCSVCVCVREGKRVCERVRVHHNLDRFVKLVYVTRLIHV